MVLLQSRSPRPEAHPALPLRQCNPNLHAEISATTSDIQRLQTRRDEVEGSIDHHTKQAQLLIQTVRDLKVALQGEVGKSDEKASAKAAEQLARATVVS